MIESLGLGFPAVPLVAALVVWALTMAAVPLVSLGGERRFPLAISTGVVGQVFLVLVVFFTRWDNAAILRAVLLGPAVWWFAEFVGSRTGIPFGRYSYTSRLQPQVAGVPVLVPLAWLMMMPASWAIADVLIPGEHRIAQAAVAAAAFTAWDVYLDPHLVRWGFWRWQRSGAYLGIPLSNFLGWFAWAFVTTLIVAPPPLDGTPLVLVYLTTWILQFLGHLVFWRWPVSAVAGLTAMGLISVPALLAL